MAMTRHEYSRLRELAEKRSRRLEAAGFEGYHAPKLRELDSNRDISREARRLEKWLEQEESTVRGARREEARREAEREAREEARRERRREYDREYREKHREERRQYDQERRRRQAELEGREYKPRPPKLTEAERRQRHNEASRRSYWKRKSEKDIQSGIDQTRAEQGNKAAQALQNLLSGLRRYGIPVRSFQELQAWGEYMKMRAENRDVKGRELASNQLFEEFAKALDRRPEDADKEISTDAVHAMMESFESWKADKEAMESEFSREMENGDYNADIFRAWLHARL